MSEDQDDVLVAVGGDLFKDPEGFYLQEKPASFVQYSLRNGNVLNLRLVGHNPLWGHLLWNAGRVTSEYLEEHGETLVKGKTVLELGAGAGLPSIVCALNGARKVVVTDYPDPDLIENLRFNVSHCTSESSIVVEGFRWGSAADVILRNLQDPSAGFDLLILADILFNHSEHGKLVGALQSTLKRSEAAVALVFFTPYRPWLLHKDLDFFEMAKLSGFSVEKLFEKVMDELMFEDDPGDVLLRKTVFGYEVRWKREYIANTSLGGW